ncbi:MAG: 4Fe-4S dicluster domain-containing protein [Firmicutes bacterium]|nr:4Fe-4S dicluster domain-containing protein [Bacillota bacterium]
MLKLIKEAGVVGAGGAGFPTHVKADSQAEIVIVNGAECEPLLRVDQLLMVHEAPLLIRGLKALVQVTGARRGIIALKKKYQEAIETLTTHLEDGLELFVIDDYYPAGDEHVLVYEVTGRAVPQGGLPIQAGCLVQNVETVINVANAIDGKAVTDKCITVGGEFTARQTVRVPVGTSYAAVLDALGMSDLTGKVAINGGPMMGAVVSDWSTPVTKTTKGILVFPEDHSLVQEKMLSSHEVFRLARAVCVQCRYCTDLCPRYLLGHQLEPHMTMRGIKYSLADMEPNPSVFLCTECGLCEQYACIFGLSPRMVNSQLKKIYTQAGMKPRPAKDTTPIPMWEYRKLPVKRLISRLGIEQYNQPAPLTDLVIQSDLVVLPLKQHVGVPAEPLVAKGQQVTRGQQVAKVPEGKLGAAVHSSISGTVEDVTDRIVIRANGGGGR